ncbi:hypothetical protein [Rhodalgimonas zhirmunskyi]|uniref:Uncharacterized protein n=1 Tax=Rhodalgimonas zhirmunskyi TaxID=2964767 RepID=A0AAJ1U5L5_9RHOB|nr:hypothetical protein [Rhodoalgimonas zhirmunskyi]MDQ2094036.1 hypothetical protein [Rhodoalgimonas zhirmunskyi]
MTARLTALLIFLPSTLMAEVCDKERPDWTPASGPATGLDEMLFLFTSLPGLGILGALILALLTRQKRYLAISALFSGLIATALYVSSTQPDALTQQAIAEGCVGPQGPPVLASTLICAVSLALLALRWLREARAARI